MEPISWEKIASSKPLRFLVGPKRREFSVHSAVIEHHSPVFAKLFNTNFKESHDGYAELPSVDEDIFICFIQYAYTGDCDPVDSDPVDSDPVDSDPVDELPVTDGGDVQPLSPMHTPASTFSGKKEKKRKPATELSNQVAKSEAWFPPHTEDLWAKFKDAACQASNLDNGPGINTFDTVGQNKRPNDLLRHARLHVFADCYDIAGLMHLTMHNLGQALVEINLTNENAEAIVALLRYCYDTPAPEKLKSVLVLYTACYVEKLWKKQSFQELLEAHGELSTALVGSMVDRLNSFQELLETQKKLSSVLLESLVESFSQRVE